MVIREQTVIVVEDYNRAFVAATDAARQLTGPSAWRFSAPFKLTSANASTGQISARVGRIRLDVAITSQGAQCGVCARLSVGAAIADVTGGLNRILNRYIDLLLQHATLLLTAELPAAAAVNAAAPYASTPPKPGIMSSPAAHVSMIVYVALVAIGLLVVALFVGFLVLMALSR